MGISCIGNMIGAIKFAKYYELGEDDWVVTIFTDSMDLYLSRVEELAAEHGAYAEVSAAVTTNGFWMPDWNTCRSLGIMTVNGFIISSISPGLSNRDVRFLNQCPMAGSSELLERNLQP